ncbi:MAG: 3'-5' exoribonuclease, partial [Ktedonobacterales bacterium]|nr:3'-5' exoribonuclease [Ktedonobacterales bacterium]
MRPQPTRVAIDLETTGLHVEQDAIIEIGAVKFAGDAVIETFETLIMPGIPLPYRIQRLTGITPTQLKGAPTLVTALPQLRAFLGDLPLVGHNIAFDVAFLRRVGLARRNPQMDTYELASILLPRLRSYTLAAVADALAIPNETHHRALADAQLARHVLLALLQRLDALDTGILEALDALVAPPDWAPRAFLRATLRERRGPPVPADGGFGGRLTTSFGELLASKLEVAPDVLTLAIARRDGETAPTLTSPLLAAPAPDAAEAATLAALHESVADCLEAGGTLLLEAAATEGHLLACLEPAVRWAASREECLLIATADVERMTHVAGAALPQARARAGIAAEALIIAALAEREAYLCPHRWYGHARAAPDGPLSREITRGLAKLVSWVRETRTGLRSEVTLSGPEAQAWELARAGEEFADSWEGCPYRRDGYCFAARAREAARTARVVVTTHAALAAMLMGRDTALPAAARVIVLEAPLLEEELRRVGSFALDREALLGLLAALASSEPGGQRTGLLPLAAARLGSAGGQHHTRAWFEQVARARATAEAFFAALAALLAESAGATSGGRRAQGEAPDPRLLRIDARVRTLSAW